MYDEELRDLREDETSLALMQEIYRSSKYPPHMRLRAAQMAIGYEHPKLAVAVNINNNFGDRMTELARKMGRSNVIDAKPSAGSWSVPRSAEEEEALRNLREAKVPIVDDGGDHHEGFE